jgi:hypothetical protein
MIGAIIQIRNPRRKKSGSDELLAHGVWLLILNPAFQ